MYTVVCAHFSDKPDKRKSQWLRLKEAMAVFPYSQHILLLADHNSVITLGKDSEYISEHDNLPPAARARAEDLSTLSAFNMCDTWQEVVGLHCRFSSCSTVLSMRTCVWTHGFCLSFCDGGTCPALCETPTSTLWVFVGHRGETVHPHILPTV